MKATKATTLEECLCAINKCRRKLGSNYEIVCNLISEAIKDRDSFWKSCRAENSRIVYECSDCGNRSAAPTRYCAKCGRNKMSKDGKIYRR